MAACLVSAAVVFASGAANASKAVASNNAAATNSAGALPKRMPVILAFKTAKCMLYEYKVSEAAPLLIVKIGDL